MKRIILTSLIICSYLISVGQVSGRCAHCPPSPKTQNGKVLSSNGTSFQWATPSSSEIYDGNGITLNNDSVNLGGFLNTSTEIGISSNPIIIDGYIDSSFVGLGISNDVFGTGYSGVGMARVDTTTSDIYFLGTIKNNAQKYKQSIYGIVAAGNNSSDAFMDISVGHQKWIVVTTDGGGVGIDTTGLEIDTNETWTHGKLAIYPNSKGGGLEVEDGDITVEGGSVGIGTTTPSGLLDIISGGSRLLFDQTNEISNTYFNGGDDQIYLDGTNHQLRFYVNDQSSYLQTANSFAYYNGSFTIGNLGGSGSGYVTVDNDGLLGFSAPAGITVSKGSFSQVGTATTTFTVSLGATLSSTAYQVNVTPTAALSAALFYVTNKTTTTFDVMYLAGLTGTVTFDWVVSK
jgi:hypothetical protein